MDDSKGIGIAIGTAILFFFALLPFLFVVALYVFFSIYAMTKGTTFASDTVNVPLLFTGIALMVALFLAALGGLVSLIGKGLVPPRRGDEDSA